MIINGSCHCGDIRFELFWESSPAQIPARACTCSFCIKHGAAWTAHPHSLLKVRMRAPAHSYCFGSKTAQFHICPQCGVVPFVTCHIDDRLYAVVNAHTFNNVPLSLIAPLTVSFEGESLEARLARRKRNWIADVEIDLTIPI